MSLIRNFCCRALALYFATTALPAHAVKKTVIVVAGMAGPGFTYNVLARRLRHDGYNTFIYQLPTLGLGEIHASAASFAKYVDHIRSDTGATTVDLVAHSEGGLVSRDYIKNFGGANKIDRLITLGSPFNGTVIANLATFLTIGTCAGLKACKQMQQGAVYLKHLNANDESMKKVHYWSFATKYDELVQPFKNAFLNSSDANITNITIQDTCWLRIVSHHSLIFDGAVYSGIRQALDGRKNIHLNCWAL